MSDLREHQTPSQYLASHGWRQIGAQGSIRYWDHPCHQPDVRGSFTTTDAAAHQKAFDANGCCDCLKEPV